MRMPAQFQMIVWTLIAVVFVGFGVFASVLQPPSTIARGPKAKPEALVSVETTSGDQTQDDSAGNGAERAPASASPQFSALSIDDKGSQAIDFTMPCEGHGRFSKNVVQVRLTGSLCGKLHGAIESSEIRNVTNGFSATVFPGANEDSFTTDYITLASGENHIRIQHFLKSGEKVERDFVIER
jgi:hypothetical protein